jgi:hypothetical protein
MAGPVLTALSAASAFTGLKCTSFIDEQGVLRSATIDSSHYASSLHGSWNYNFVKNNN